MAERTVVPVNSELFRALGGGSTWSDAVCVGDLIWVTGQLGWDK